MRYNGDMDPLSLQPMSLEAMIRAMERVRQRLPPDLAARLKEIVDNPEG